jgi:putative phosphoribosyl transferase
MISPTIDHRSVRIGPRGLPGEWSMPARPVGLVAFVHGSGSSRTSPRNRFVAQVLQQRAMGTLQFDLLSEDEAADRANVFDIPLLERRVLEALAWIVDQPGYDALPIGLFGASTGAAAALRAAAARPSSVAAVVSRGGRCDLAGDALARVHVPTLLIIGALDTDVLRLNRECLRCLAGVKRLEVVPGATHLFEEPGTLEVVAHLAGDWFARHLTRSTVS